MRLVMSGTDIGPNQPRAKNSATRSVTKASGMPVTSSPISIASIRAEACSMPSAFREPKNSNSTSGPSR